MTRLHVWLPGIILSHLKCDFASVKQQMYLSWMRQTKVSQKCLKTTDRFCLTRYERTGIDHLKPTHNSLQLSALLAVNPFSSFDAVYIITLSDLKETLPKSENFTHHKVLIHT